MDFEFSERFWKILANVWTYCSMAFFIVDFLNGNSYTFLAGPISAITLQFWAFLPAPRNWTAGKATIFPNTWVNALWSPGP